MLSVRNIDVFSRSIFSRVLFHQFDSIRVVGSGISAETFC